MDGKLFIYNIILLVSKQVLSLNWKISSTIEFANIIVAKKNSKRGKCFISTLLWQKKFKMRKVFYFGN